MKKIIVCADNAALSKNVCEFGINLAKNFGFGLVFLSADKAISCLAKVFDRIENIYDYICDDIKNNLLCAAKNSSKSQKCLENMQEFALKTALKAKFC